MKVDDLRRFVKPRILPAMRSKPAAPLRQLISPVYVPVFFLASGLSASFPGFPQYVAGLGAGLAMVGVLVSLLGLGNILADLPAGALIHRFGDRRIILFSSIVAGVAAFGTAASESLAIIAILRVIIGLCHSAMVMGVMAFVRERVVAAARGRSLAFVWVSVRLGFFVGPLAGGFLAERYGVPAAFLFQGIAMVGASASLLMTGAEVVKDSSQGPATGEPETGVDSGGSIVRRLIESRGRELAVVAFVVFTLMLLRQARQIIFPLWGEQLELSVTVIGAIMSASAAIELFIFAFAGWLMDHAGRRPTLALCVGTMGLGIAALPLTGDVTGYLILALAIGVGNGFGSGIVMTLGTDFAPDGAVGPFLGIWRLFGDTGSMIGPFAVGALAAALTLPASLVATGALGALAAMTMLAVGPETRKV